MERFSLESVGVKSLHIARDLGSAAVAAARNKLCWALEPYSEDEKIPYEIVERTDPLVSLENEISDRERQEIDHLLPHGDTLRVSTSAKKRFKSAQPALEKLKVDGESHDHL